MGLGSPLVMRGKVQGPAGWDDEDDGGGRMWTLLGQCVTLFSQHRDNNVGTLFKDDRATNLN